jgi:hypothetical protein
MLNVTDFILKLIFVSSHGPVANTTTSLHILCKQRTQIYLPSLWDPSDNLETIKKNAF